MVALSLSPQLALFRALVTERLSEPHISLKSSDGSLLKLFGTKIAFDRSAVVSRAATTGDMSSQKDLMLIDCPELGSISASRDVILIRCPDHGKVAAGRNVHCYDSGNNDTQSGLDTCVYIDKLEEMYHRHGVCEGHIKTFVETVYLVDYIVKGAVIFVNHNGESCRGRVIMDSRSRIEDLEHTNAEIIHIEDIIDHKDKEKSEKVSLHPPGTDTSKRSLSNKKRKLLPEST